MNAPFGLRHCCCRRFNAAFTRHVFFSGENKIFKVSVWLFLHAPCFEICAINVLRGTRLRF